MKIIIKKETHETVKKELLNSSKENDDVEQPGLNKTANTTNDPHKAILLIH